MKLWKNRQEEIGKLKIVATLANKRCERLEFALDKLGKIVGLEWQDAERRWTKVESPKGKQDG